MCKSNRISILMKRAGLLITRTTSLSAEEAGSAGNRRPPPPALLRRSGRCGIWEHDSRQRYLRSGRELRLPEGLRGAGLGLPLPALGKGRAPSHLRKAPERAPAGAGREEGGVCSCIRSDAPHIHTARPRLLPNLRPCLPTSEAEAANQGWGSGGEGHPSRGKAHSVGDRMQRG